jgi:hypothetical protein
MATSDVEASRQRAAEARLAELKSEIEQIYAAFPDLRDGRPRAAQDGAPSQESATPRRRKQGGTWQTVRDGN